MGEHGDKVGPKGSKRSADIETVPRPPTEDSLLLRSLVVSSSDDAIMVMSGDGTISFWNEGARRTLGYSEDEAVGMPVHALFVPGHEDQASDAMELIKWEGAAPPFIAAMRTRGGGTIHASVRISPLRDEQGMTMGAALVARDVTADIESHAESERAAWRERKRFIDIVDQMPSYIILMSPDRRIVFANRSFIEQFEEPRGRLCHEVLFGSSEPCEDCQSFEVLRTNRPHTWEWTGPNGRQYAVFDYPFIDEDGSSVVLESGVDITERRQADEALRKAGTYNRSLIEASLDLMVTIGPDGKITDANSATANITGVSQADLAGTDFSDYFTDPAAARAVYETVFRDGLVRDYELEIRRRDGHITPVLYNASVYRDDAGNIIGVFAAARDITARKRYERELRERQERETERLLELEKFQRLTVGRELKMVELKKEVAALKREIESLRDREA